MGWCHRESEENCLRKEGRQASLIKNSTVFSIPAFLSNGVAILLSPLAFFLSTFISP